MNRVKGTVLVDFIKTIRADKSGRYNGMLTEEDKKIVGDRILPSGWYAYDTFKNCFNATVAVLAKNDMEKVRQWGRLYGGSIVSNVYKNILREGQPMESLKKYGTYIRSFFDFGEIEVAETGPGEAMLTMRGFDPEFVAQYYMMLGWIERSLELCGAKNITSSFVKKSWQGSSETSVKINWNI